MQFQRNDSSLKTFTSQSKNRMFGKKSRLSGSRSTHRRQRLLVEMLEDRRLLASDLPPLLDINVTSNLLGSDPTRFVDVEGTAFFTATTPTTGRELWKSDGTVEGTVLVKDVRAGNIDSSISNMINVDGILYFAANDGIHGYELWKSDGTSDGTVLVKDIHPGSYYSSIGGLTNVAGIVYFKADDGVHGIELWKSDGTENGTQLVKDINLSIGSYPESLTNLNGTLYFSAYDELHGEELWKTDGSAAGTVLVKDVNPGSNGAIIRSLFELDNTLYFVAHDGVRGNELWKSDGTSTGTVLVKDINVGSGASFPDWLTNVNGTLFFRADNGINGRELWKSDGTQGGTVLVRDILPGINGSFPFHLTANDDTLYFQANEGVHGFELWKSDGSQAGTSLVKDIIPGSAGAGAGDITNLDGLIYFIAYDGIHGTSLWRSDGTDIGTVLVTQVAAGNSGAIQNLTKVNDRLFFSADDGIHGYEPWISDGTATGTHSLKDIDRGTNDAELNGLTSVNGSLFFTANDAIAGQELWKSDGTAAGTGIVKDINPGAGDSLASNLTAVQGMLFFRADDGVHGSELWKTDGTAAGTALVKDIVASSDGSNPQHLTNANGTLFFTADQGVSGRELWKSDGTTTGTKLVKDLIPGNTGSYPRNLTSVNGLLYFTTIINESEELWKSDGTVSGTVMVKGFPVLNNYNDPNLKFLTNVNGTLYFTASDGSSGYELWKSDGSAGGTVVVKDLNPGFIGSYPQSLTNVGGVLYFGNESAQAAELWKSDGTAAGTVLVKELNYGGPFGLYLPSSLTNVDGVLYFTVESVDYGAELWKSDGTDDGTVLVKDLAPGTAGSNPTNLRDVNGTLYFTANDGINGEELWKTDGTAEGTELVTDFTGDSGGSNPSAPVAVGSNLFVAATTDSFGRELYVLPSPKSPLAISTGLVNASTTQWTTATLDRTFNDMVVVATLSTSSANPSVATRIRNAGSGNTFEVMLQRTDGKTDAVTVPVHYMAVEAGVYTVAEHGVKLEAIKSLSTVTDRKNSYVGEEQTASLVNSYANPVVVGQVMTANDPRWSAFWSHGPSATKPANGSSIWTGKHVGSDPLTSRADETIGFIVIEAGNGNVNGFHYSASLGAKSIDGVFNNGDSYPLSLVNPDGAVASISGIIGSDGGWAVLYGDNPLTDRIALAIEEDQAHDFERSHANEQVSYIVFEGVAFANQNPVANDDGGVGFTTTKNESFTTASVLANDTDPDKGDVLSVLSFDIAATMGLVASNNDGSFDYDPNGQFDDLGIGETATDTFTYTVSDGNGGTDTAMVTITIHGPLASPGPQLQTGVAMVSTTGWTTVTLPQSYNDMVVVTTLQTSKTNPSVVTRIRNAGSGDTFEITLQHAGTLGGTNDVSALVHYTVVEAGVYTVAEHGVKMDAIKTLSTVTDRKGSYIGQDETTALTNVYTNPVVIGQVMTFNDPSWSAFWSHGPTPFDPASGSAVWVGKHVGSDPISTRAVEQLGFITIEQGNGTIDGWQYSAALGSSTIDGVFNNGNSYPLTLSNPTTAVASQSGMHGSDGGWAVLIGADPLTSGLWLAIEEDQAQDFERTHANEQVAYLVFKPLSEPESNRVSVLASENDQLAIRDAASWRMAEPIMVNGEFQTTARNVLEGQETIHTNLTRPWQNFVRSGDVDNSGDVTAADALEIIFELSQHRYSDPATGELYAPLSIEQWPGLYFDRSGDNRVSALDALGVINDLYLQQLSQSADSVDAEVAATLTDFVPTLEANDFLSSRFPNFNSPSETQNAASMSRAVNQDSAIRSDNPVAFPYDAKNEPVRQSSDRAVDEVLADELFLTMLGNS